MAANLFRSFFDHTERALRYTGPLYYQGDEGTPEVFASAVFFKHLGQHFIITAAHAIAELRTRRVWIGGDATIVELQGRFFHTGQPGQIDFNDDDFDLGFFPLSDAQVATLPGVSFLSERSIDAGLDGGKKYFYSVGFIASDHQPSEGEQQVASATGILAFEANETAYRQRNVSRASHLLLSFNRRRTSGEQGEVPTPPIMGMSGCGVWRRAGLPYLDQLVAILIEHHDRNRNFIVSTRASMIIPALTAYCNGDGR